MFWRLKAVFLSALLLLTGLTLVSAQDAAEKKEEKKSQNPEAGKSVTAEQVAESAIVIYGGLGGRQTLNQIRKTTAERGKVTLTNAGGQSEQINYQRWIIRADSLEKEKNRLDQEYPNSKFALVYNGEKLFGLFNDSVFMPREDAAKTFQNQIWHGLEALLRYKENESKLELAGREKILGVDYYLLDVTDKQNRKTRFYISAKSFRVMMLDYEADGTKFRRKFHDYNYAQGTLVPFRTILLANDKKIEETEVGTITFGQRVEEGLFQEAN